MLLNHQIKPSRQIPKNEILSKNIEKIRSFAALPRSLNVPEGNLSAVTDDTIRMLLWGLKRPQKNMKNFKYHSSNLFSCMILSVENLHSVVNRKEATHTDICYNYQRINKISNKVECPLFHKHRKLISFAKISGTIKRLEISKAKVQACGNSSKFRPET